MKNKDHITEYVKASSHGEWMANDDNSFKSKHKIHKSKKNYSRKLKHKKNEING